MSKEFKETCSCGASISVPEYIYLEAWREKHHSYHPKEEPQAEGAGGCSIERAPQWDYDNRVPIGFAANITPS